MTASFAIIAAVTLAAAVAAVGMRHLVHCALALTVALGGLAAAYLQLGAQFLGFAQVLVYIGAVAILIVFAILLTRGSERGSEPVISGGWLPGLLVALLVLGIFVYAIAHSRAISSQLPPAPDASVRRIGETLMNEFVLPLEAVGLLLTAALIGAVLLAMKEPEPKAPEQKSPTRSLSNS